MASSPQRRLHGMLLLSTVLSVGSFAPCRAQPTSIATFQDLLAALASTDAAEIGLTEELLTSAEGPSVLVNREVVLAPAPGVPHVVWDQAGTAGRIRVGAGGVLTVKGPVTFVGCPPLGDGTACRVSEYLPGVIEVEDGGQVVLQGSQVVCSAEDAPPPGLALADFTGAEGDAGTADVWRIGSRKAFVKRFEGCAGGSDAQGNWTLWDVSLVRDVPGCYASGLVVSNGKELQSALSAPNPNIYIVEDVTMQGAEWPENGTHVHWPVNITACGGVVLDTNYLPQNIFLWTGGHMLIDGHNNMTIANSKPTPRRGNVWQMVGALSVEANGSVILKDLNITSSVPSALHREDITLNPPRFWPLPCCTEGELVHHNASSMELTWRLPKADWVYGSTGNVLPETGFWMFDNVGAHVVTSPTESCFEDYSVVVTTAQQLLDALSDPELGHIELRSGMDIRDWKTDSVTVERDLIIRSCERHALTIPARRDVIMVQGAGNLVIEGILTLSFEVPEAGEPRNPFTVRDGGQLRLDGLDMDCATVTVYPWDAILAQAFLDSNGSVFLIDDTTACVKGRPYLVEPNPSEGVYPSGSYTLETITVTTTSSYLDQLHRGSGLKAWAIALIAVLLAVAVAAVGAFAYVRRRGRRKDSFNSDSSFGSSSGPVPASGSLHGMVASIMNQQLGAPITNVSQHKSAKADVQILELLGAGGSAKVYRGYWKGVVVAFKVVQLPPQQSKLEKEQQKMAMETAISTALRHPNVVQTFSYEMVPLKSTYQGAAHGIDVRAAPDAVMSATELCSDNPDSGTLPGAEWDDLVQLWEVRIIQEFCTRGSLYSALASGNLSGQNGRRTPPDVMLCLQVALDVACGMHHIHSMKICHGDLKAQNVLLTAMERETGTNMLAKVADFGLSVLMGTDQTHVSGITHGTVTHMAPEVLLTGRMTPKTDVYAYGMFLYEIFSGRKVFDGMTGMAITQAVIVQQRRPTFPPGTPTRVVQLACKCWEQAEEQRPDFDEIMEDVTQMINLHQAGQLNKFSSGVLLLGDQSSGSGVKSEGRQSTDADSAGSGLASGDHSELGVKALQMQGGTTHSISFSAASMARPSRRISRLSGDRRSEPDRTDYHRSDAKTADDVDVDEEDDNDDDDGGSESGNTVILFDPTQAAPGGGSDAPNAV